MPFSRQQFRADEGLLGRIEAGVHFDMRQQCKKLAKLHLVGLLLQQMVRIFWQINVSCVIVKLQIPNIFGEPLSGIFQQKYHGMSLLLTIFGRLAQ